MDENAVCKSFDMWFDQRYVYAAFCVCKNGYRKEAGSVGGKCQPGNISTINCILTKHNLLLSFSPGILYQSAHQRILAGFQFFSRLTENGWHFDFFCYGFLMDISFRKIPNHSNIQATKQHLINVISATLQDCAN